MSLQKITEIPWPTEGRWRNDPWYEGRKERCSTCGNDGVVQVATSDKGSEEYGPCPHCRVGFMVEFGYGGAYTERGKFYFFRSETPWHQAGYWQAQNVPSPGHPGPQVFVPYSETQRRSVILARAIAAGGFTYEMLAELYRDDDKGLEEHLRITGQEPPRDEQATISEGLPAF